MISKLRIRFVMSCLAASSISCANAQGPKLATYGVTDLGTLGGTYSYAYAINNFGIVAAGGATQAQTDGITTTAFIWNRGTQTNLGTLGGADCLTCSSEAAATSMNGITGILSETANWDVNGEDFCGFGSHRQCRAALSQDGALSPLPLLEGGNNSQVYDLNNRGEAAGFSETGGNDSGCVIPYQKFRFEAVKWNPAGSPQPLRPLQGDTVSFALGINDSGQSVGVSGLCSNTTFPPVLIPTGPHAVIWDKDGTPTSIDTLPGAMGNNVANSINNRGDVVGTQLISDGTVHSFLWNKTDGLTDLMMPGTFLTVAPPVHSIDENRDIVGFAVNENGPLAFIWKNGNFTDLNTLLAADSPWYVFNATSINDAGQIAATGFNPATGEVHALLLSLLPQNGAPLARSKVNVPSLPDAIRNKFLIKK